MPHFGHQLPVSQERVVTALVRLLAPAFPKLDDATCAEVQRDTAAFVVSQICAMPSFLRLPYQFAILAFDWLPVLRFHRRFSSLDPSVQTAAVTRWTNSPIGPMRDFVKLIRSCALLQYFDHPLVRATLEAQTRTGS